MCTAAAVTAAVLMAACGSSSSSPSGGSSGGTASHTGTLQGHGKEIVIFGGPASVAYYHGLYTAAQKETQRLGYKLKTVQANFNQVQQDQQVQQFVSSGQKPAAFLLIPMVSAASTSAFHSLSAVAPTWAANATAPKQADQFIKGYIGVNDFSIGRQIAEMFMKLRAQAKADGHKLHNPKGNLLVIGFPAGLQSGINREAAFKAATAAHPFNVLSIVHGASDPSTGYQLASQDVPKFKSEGIDFIWSANSDIGQGVIKALKENGLTPGKDVIVAGGNCNHQLISQLPSGEFSGSILQSPAAEGRLYIDTVAQYLASGKVTNTSVTLPASAGVPPELDTVRPVARNTYVPTIPITGKSGLQTKLWGGTAAAVCP